MRKTFSIILLIVITISLTACGKNNSGEESLSDPVYEVLISHDVPTDELVDAFAKYGKQFFMAKYSDIVYTQFYFEGDFNNLETVNGDMKITYLATDTSGLLNSPAKLVASYDKSNRHVTYYELDTGEKTKANPSPVTSAEFKEVVEKMKGYLENLGISSGYIEMTEYALDGLWVINHLPDKSKKADVQLKIDSITLELLEYTQNP